MPTASMVVRGSDLAPTDGSACGRSPLVWGRGVSSHSEAVFKGCVCDQRGLVCEDVFRKSTLRNGEVTPLVTLSLPIFLLPFATMALTNFSLACW